MRADSMPLKFDKRKLHLDFVPTLSSSVGERDWMESRNPDITDSRVLVQLLYVELRPIKRSVSARQKTRRRFMRKFPAVYNQDIRYALQSKEDYLSQ